MMNGTKKPLRANYAASNSFDYRELKVLISVCDTALRGGDIRIILRSPEFAGIHGKVRRMYERLDHAIAEDTLKELAPKKAGSR